MALFSALLIGTLFGLGLSISEMTNPARVIGFLDIAGRWDPTLIFVMGGALAVTLPAYTLILRRARPLLDGAFHLPAKRDIDRRLLIGAALFGIGWGLGGFCPGPALASLASGAPAVFGFVLAMIAGQWLAGRFAG
ncbi:MAG: YeeE/YedE family protein [Deltaproteobacteria bacterium]|nr:YeeE/YedE family protein [Deltaproteobacteria bacterium]